MLRKSIIYVIFLQLLLIMIPASCGLVDKQEIQKVEDNSSAELHVAAATGLRFAMEEIGSAFEEDTGVKVVFQFGSSGNLAQQIAGGAPVDLFCSANVSFVDNLVSQGDVIEESLYIFAMGRIVLAVNEEFPLDVDVLGDLLSDQVDIVVIANPNHAPYGFAGKEALQNEGLWDQIEDKLVYAETVSQAMQYVQTGNAPVGIIALSFADVPGIKYSLIDEELHTPLKNVLGVVSHSRKKEMAARFAAYIRGQEGRAILEKHRFCLPQ